MREKIIGFVVIIVIVCITSMSTVYIMNKTQPVSSTSSASITLNESDSISKSVEKVYDSVVIIENYQNNSENYSSSGSGFIYKSDSKFAYIMTNNHVVEGATSVKVVTTAEEEVEATVLGTDEYIDIAVLRIDKNKAPAIATIGKSDISQIGDTVFTVGTPMGTNYIGTVTKGIISGKDRSVTVSVNNSKYMMSVLQTDASINSGNSGGPLVNINGDVIGITSMKLASSGVEGMGFAIPIEIAMSGVNKLEKGEAIERPSLGVSLLDLDYAKYYGFKISDKIKSGVVIADIELKSSADQANLEKGDIITKLNNEVVKSSAHFRFLLYQHEVGDTVNITYDRNGTTKSVKIKLKESIQDN